MKPLTYAQEQVLAFVCDYLEENGYPPTVKEIGDGVGTSSTSTAHSHLRALHRKGYIEVKSSPRAIKVNRTVSGR